jgi:plasmid maintenance system antidote protein VapI
LGEKQPVTPALAVRLGKLFGDGAGVWLRMQAAHDTWHAERALAKEIKKIPTLSAA